MSAAVPSPFHRCSAYLEQYKPLMAKEKIELFQRFRQNAGAHAYATRNASRQRLACANIFSRACNFPRLHGTGGTPSTAIDLIGFFAFHVSGTVVEQCKKRRNGAQCFASAASSGYDYPVAVNPATGFGDPVRSGVRAACNRNAAFSMPARVQFNGRAGRESRKALPVLRRFANPFGSAHPFGDGCAVRNLNESEHTMSKPSIGASAPRTTPDQTAFRPFFPCTPDQSALFAVNAGVDTQDALEMASVLLASAREITTLAAEETPNGTVYAAAHLVEIAKAVVDSITSQLAKETRHV